MSNFNEFIYKWDNNSNAAAYNALSLNTLPNYASLGGLENGCDLDLISTYINQATSILELAAGYGRVINKLKAMDYHQHLVAVERCQQFYEILLSRYADYAEILCSSIQNFHTQEKFDLILWLWSGLCDFAKHEQLAILRKASHFLTPNGTLVLDTMPHNIKPSNAIILQDQSYIIPNATNPLYGYTPSCEELDIYAAKLGLKILHLPYETATGRARILHFLSK